MSYRENEVTHDSFNATTGFWENLLKFELSKDKTKEAQDADMKTFSNFNML